MRYLHKDFEPVRQYFAAEPCEIWRLEWDLKPVESGYASLPWTLKRRDAHGPQASGVAEVEAFFRRAERPERAGTVLHHYFHVNRPPSDRAVSLVGAIEHVEAFAGPREFLLVGYPEGGLISVSRVMLPFQEQADLADHWWGPR